MSKQTAQYKAVARKDMTYGQWIWKEMKRNWVAYLLILPYVLIFTLFTIVPVILSMVISFTDFNMLQWPNFVGLENFIQKKRAGRFVEHAEPLAHDGRSISCFC